MLITSDGYQRQYESLNLDDIKSAWFLLSALDTDYVAFYNCGQDGGCSRLHKHVQLIPTPPNLFASFLDAKDGKPSRVPFEWFYCRLNPRFRRQNAYWKSTIIFSRSQPRKGKVYLRILAWLHLTLRVYTILFSQDVGWWCSPGNALLSAINKEAGVNAIGMLGYIAVATRKEIDNWIQLGLTDSLRELGVAK